MRPTDPDRLTGRAPADIEGFSSSAHAEIAPNIVLLFPIQFDGVMSAGRTIRKTLRPLISEGSRVDDHPLAVPRKFITESVARGGAGKVIRPDGARVEKEDRSAPFQPP